MSMTKEEAIKWLEEIVQDTDTYWGSCSKALQKELDEQKQVFLLDLSALRPVSREQVEKVWFGCDICREDKEVKSDNFCGAATMRIVGDSIDLRGDEKKIKFFGHIYAPSFSVRFCPFCGKPLTDEAVDMVMERLEALYEET